MVMRTTVTEERVPERAAVSVARLAAGALPPMTLLPEVSAAGHREPV
jgi:hypothetical protein